jgi:hypothetical protein
MVKKMIRFVPLQEALNKVKNNILKGKPLFDNRIISLAKVAEKAN